jgi:hypothetical protein
MNTLGIATKASPFHTKQKAEQNLTFEEISKLSGDSFDKQFLHDNRE